MSTWSISIVFLRKHFYYIITLSVKSEYNATTTFHHNEHQYYMNKKLIRWGPIMICLAMATNHDFMNKSRLIVMALPMLFCE